jgi:secreted protein acidic and rich in cysteine
MEMKLFLVAVLLAALACTTSAEKHRRRHRRPQHESSTDNPISHNEDIISALVERLDEEKFQESEKRRLEESGFNNEIIDNEVLVDPCSKVHCSAGRVCELSEAGEAECNCIKECPYETEARRKVCTSQNETWNSDCEVYQQRCFCLTDSELCKGPKYHHVQIEYYGQCRDMPTCLENEMADFPRRMRDWLFNIMRDLADRRELAPHYLKMEKEAEANLTRRWTNAAIWKWCDLDAHDNDRSVSRHELFPIRAPLMALEHCIAPFLDSCDADNDHRITLEEWGTCLELDESDLEDRCVSIDEAAN